MNRMEELQELLNELEEPVPALNDTLKRAKRRKAKRNRRMRFLYNKQNIYAFSTIQNLILFCLFVFWKLLTFPINQAFRLLQVSGTPRESGLLHTYPLQAHRGVCTSLLFQENKAQPAF